MLNQVDASERQAMNEVRSIRRAQANTDRINKRICSDKKNILKNLKNNFKYSINRSEITPESILDAVNDIYNDTNDKNFNDKFDEAKKSIEECGIDPELNPVLTIGMDSPLIKRTPSSFNNYNIENSGNYQPPSLP